MLAEKPMTAPSRVGAAPNTVNGTAGAPTNDAVTGRAVSEYSRTFASMAPETRRKAREPWVLTLTKTQAHATVHGRPVAIAQDRASYLHDLDSAVAFKRLNDNDVSSAGDFIRTMSATNLTYSWFYVGERSIAFAYLPPDLAAVGQRGGVEVFGQWIGFEVVREPLWDPEGARIRS